jgi:hypothetical protein
MGGKNNCCKICLPPPNIILPGMTPVGDWYNIGLDLCCWERVYNYNDAQPWVLISDYISWDYRSESTSVVEYLEFRQERQKWYRLALDYYGNPEECPVLPTIPDYDCGTWVPAATRTIEALSFAKERYRYWTKQKNIVVRYGHKDIACDEEPDTRKFIVQIQQNFWWSYLRHQNYNSAPGVNEGWRSSYILETCFDWITSAPSSWTHDSYPTTEDTPWVPSLSLTADDGIITESFVVKTKVYDEMPESDTWTVSDPHTLECWSFCSGFEQMINPIDCIQEYVPSVTYDCTPTNSQHDIAPPFTRTPCPSGACNASCSCYSCVYCPPPACEGCPIPSGSITNYPAATIDCSARTFLIDILTISCEYPLTAIPNAGLATYNPLFLNSRKFEYDCGPACVNITCTTVLSGWYYPVTEGERCWYLPPGNGWTAETQVSFDYDIYSTYHTPAICQNFITLNVDYNL